MNRLLVLAGLVAIFVESPVAAEPPPVTSDDVRACDAALAMVKVFTARQVNGVPWVVADSPPSQWWAGAAGKEQMLLTQQWQGKSPAREMTQAFATSQPRSALSTCPAIGVYLDQIGIKHGEQAANDATVDNATKRPIRVWSSTTLRLSLPLIDDSGDDAVVEIGIAGGQTIGGGSIHHLQRKPSGDWADVGFLRTWIG